MHPGDVYETGFDESNGNHLDAAATCPECDGSVITEAGERHCEDCGLILEAYRIDHGATARRVPDAGTETNPRHVGAPRTPTMHDGGLTTTIGRFRDGNGRQLDTDTRRRLRRLRKLHRRARHGSKRERNLERGCQEVGRLSGALGLGGSLEERAAMCFRRAQADDLLRGRSIESMAAGSVYAACRCAGLPRSADEIGAVARVGTSKVLHAYRVLNDGLNLPAPPQTPRDFVPRYAADLDVDTRVRKRALDLAERAIETGVANGRKPSGVAAACLYQASREVGPARTQAAVADVAGVTPVTVRTGWKALLDAITLGRDDRATSDKGTPVPVDIRGGR
jgi:transcription initiation factor TFIIB